MKKRFTRILAALALLVFIAPSMVAWGQSDYSTDYTGNITLSTTGGTSASNCKVKINNVEYSGIKAGTGSVAGAVKVTVPSGTKYLHLHLAGWNGETVTLAVTPSGYSDNIALTSNSGISGNSPFTFSGDPSTSNYYKVITFSNALNQDTQLTFTATGGKRFVIWGVTSEEEGGSQTETHTLTFVASPANGGTVSVNNNTTGTITLEEGEDYNIIATPAEVGFAFSSWTVNGTGSSVANANNASTTFHMGTEDATLTAIFEEVDTYTVTYVANGPDAEAIADTYNDGTTVTVRPANTFNYAGHAFIGWNTDEEGNGTSYEAGGTFTINGDVILYAQWEESDETTYDFTQIEGFSSWGNGYSDHEVEYSDATVTFYAASRQTGTITDRPVTKAGPVTLVMTDESTLNGVTFVLTQWGSKTKTVALHYSTNGGDSYTSTNITSSDFTITCNNLPAGTNAVKITFSENSNQVGIASATIVKNNTIDPRTPTTTSITAPEGFNTDIYLGTTAGTLTATVKDDQNNTISNTTVTWSSSDEGVATIDSDGVVTLVAVGTTIITANYAGVPDQYQASSGTYELTVTSSAPYVQPTTVEIIPNYTFWGQSAQFSGDAHDELSGSKDNISLDWTRGSGSMYANQNAMRFYKDNTLTFTAPEGYEIKSIVLDVSGSADDLTFSPEGYDVQTTTWTGSSATVTMTRPANASSYATISQFTITIGQPSSVATPTFSPESGSEFGDEGLSVTIACATTDASIFYTLDGSIPNNTSTLYEGAFTLNTTTTVKAIAYDGTNYSNVATATYTYVDPNAPGTLNNPYTVAQALAAINAGTGVNDVYATGTVSEIVTEFNAQYGNITYNISVDGSTESDQLQAYRGKSYNETNFISAEELKVGDVVVIYGDLQYYASGATPNQFKASNQLVSLKRDGSYIKVVKGYDESEGGYVLVASPVASVTPSADNGFLTDAYDLYKFDQNGDDEGKEWLNYEAQNFGIVSKEGYLYASQGNTTLTFSGTDVTDGTVQLAYNGDVDFAGWNLVGNPFGKTAYITKSFYKMNADGTELIEGSGAINPMEGVFVIATENNEQLTFSTTAPAAPEEDLVVNLNSSRGTVIDRAVVRFGQGDQLPKFQINPNNTKIYVTEGNKDYAVVRSAAEAEMPVSFRASENGTYTLAVEAENVEMNYLHLIDNLTGMDVDLLQTPSYTFEAKTSDYASRFRLVFKANSTNENNAETFAYFNGTNWTVSNVGEATLQVVDVTGRTVANQMINGNAELNLNQPAGVYVIRLVNGDNVKTQKVVVR